MGRGGIRVARGLTLALSCLVLSLGMHVAAGGRLHLDLLAGLAAVLLSIGCVAAAAQRAGFGSVLGVVGVSQVLLHTVAGGHGGEIAGSGGITMVLAHLLAALVLSVLLTGAERTLWVLASVLRPFVLPRLQPVRVVESGRPWWPGPAPLPAGQVLVGAAGVRGPPGGCTG